MQYNLQGKLLFLSSWKATYSKLMIIGGYPQEAEGDVEIVDLSRIEQTCQKPSNYPKKRGMAATYFPESNKIMSCGGLDLQSDCYSFNKVLFFVCIFSSGIQSVIMSCFTEH